MMIASDPVLQLLCAVLVMLVPWGIGLVLPRVPFARVAALVAAAMGGMASIVVDVVATAPIDLAASSLDAAGAAAFAASVALLAAVQHGARASTVIAALWALVIYQPVFAAVVSSVPPVAQVLFGAVDFAAVLATHVSAATVLVVLSWRSGVDERSTDGGAGVTMSRAALATMLVVIGGTAWMLGLERVLSESSGRIAVNAL